MTHVSPHVTLFIINLYKLKGVFVSVTIWSSMGQPHSRHGFHWHRDISLLSPRRRSLPFQLLISPLMRSFSKSVGKHHNLCPAKSLQIISINFEQVRTDPLWINGWNYVGILTQVVSLPTAGEGNVFTRVCDSVHDRPHGYSVTVCYGAVGTHPTGILSCFVEWLWCCGINKTTKKTVS